MHIEYTIGSLAEAVIALLFLFITASAWRCHEEGSSYEDAFLTSIVALFAVVAVFLTGFVHLVLVLGYVSLIVFTLIAGEETARFCRRNESDVNAIMMSLLLVASMVLSFEKVEPAYFRLVPAAGTLAMSFVFLSSAIAPRKNVTVNSKGS